MVVLDAAGRQFARSTYASKLAFLAPFALAKVRRGSKVLYRHTRRRVGGSSHTPRGGRERCCDRQASANLGVGVLADTYGRRYVEAGGWAVGLLVPFLVRPVQ
jgi:hypothetical protein